MIIKFELENTSDLKSETKNLILAGVPWMELKFVDMFLESKGTYTQPLNEDEKENMGLLFFHDNVFDNPDFPIKKVQGFVDKMRKVYQQYFSAAGVNVTFHIHILDDITNEILY